MSGALFLGIVEGTQREIKRIHRRGAKDAEKCKSFICPDDSSGQIKGVPLPAATDSDLRDRKLDSVIEQIMPVQNGISPRRLPS